MGEPPERHADREAGGPRPARRGAPGTTARGPPQGACAAPDASVEGRLVRRPAAARGGGDLTFLKNGTYDISIELQQAA